VPVVVSNIDCPRTTLYEGPVTTTMAPAHPRVDNAIHAVIPELRQERTPGMPAILATTPDETRPALRRFTAAQKESEHKTPLVSPSRPRGLRPVRKAQSCPFRLLLSIDNFLDKTNSAIGNLPHHVNFLTFRNDSHVYARRCTAPFVLAFPEGHERRPLARCDCLRPALARSLEHPRSRHPHHY